jgi:CheY-like chemotaxis protein
VRILVAEDDQVTSKAHCAILRGLGHMPISAFDAVQALMAAMRDPKPEVIMLDLNMPGGTGMGALDKLKSSSRTAEIPVIVLSGVTDPKARRAALQVELLKHADGSAVLRCTRADGSVTWQHQRGQQARFFPLHDLTHFAVESTLGAADGFFGLIARGWDISETTGKGARGALPPGALYIENLVGLLERAGIGRAPLDAGELNAELARLVAHGRLTHAPAVTAAQLAALRSSVEALHQRWASLDDGGTLALSFATPAGAPR